MNVWMYGKNVGHMAMLYALTPYNIAMSLHHIGHLTGKCCAWKRPFESVAQLVGNVPPLPTLSLLTLHWPDATTLWTWHLLSSQYGPHPHQLQTSWDDAAADAAAAADDVDDDKIFDGLIAVIAA